MPGSLFVAVLGENVDGHDFASAAVAAGAAAVLATRPVGVPAVIVADTVLALGRLARLVVSRLALWSLTVVGVTGSQGKTSTKDLITPSFSVLEHHGPHRAVAHHRAAGLAQQRIGLPLTAGADACTRFWRLTWCRCWIPTYSARSRGRRRCVVLER